MHRQTPANPVGEFPVDKKEQNKNTDFPTEEKAYA